MGTLIAGKAEAHGGEDRDQKKKRVQCGAPYRWITRTWLYRQNIKNPNKSWNQAHFDKTAVSN